VVGEVLVVWLGTLLAIRLVVVVSEAVGFDALRVLVPILFMYAPVWWMRSRGEDPDTYPLAIPGLSDRAAWWEVARWNAWFIPPLLVLWVPAYHVWQTQVFGFQFQGTLPSSFLELVAYHLIFAGLPEELFYRGWMQSRLDEVMPPKWRIAGAQVGPALVWTSLIFAFGHSLVRFQWWHFAIFFPSLLFGWMRARSGGVIAGAFFHAFCNVLVSTLDTLYGVVEP
jgi:membrane protease YdiL (CAAX protease family)